MSSAIKVIQTLNPNEQTCLSVFWTASCERQTNVADESVECQTPMQAGERTLLEQREAS